VSLGKIVGYGELCPETGAEPQEGPRGVIMEGWRGSEIGRCLRTREISKTELIKQEIAQKQQQDNKAHGPGKSRVDETV